MGKFDQYLLHPTKIAAPDSASIELICSKDHPRGHSWSCYILQGRFKLYSLQYRRFFGTSVISVSE